MPLYYRNQASADSSLIYAVWRITESEEELTAPLPYGSVLYACAKLRYKSASRRLEWLAVRRLAHELGIDGRLIDYHPSGRPFLKGDDSPRISISHTRGYAAVALHPSKSVGIDIEQRGDKVMRVRKRFVSAAEEANIALPKSRGIADVEKTLLTLWTAKETLFKLMDSPGIDFVRHLHVHPFNISGQGEFTAHETFTPQEQRFRLYYHCFPDFILTYGCHAD